MGLCGAAWAKVAARVKIIKGMKTLKTKIMKMKILRAFKALKKGL